MAKEVARKAYNEKQLSPMSGGIMLLLTIAVFLGALGMMIGGIAWEVGIGEDFLDETAAPLVLILLGLLVLCAGFPLMIAGFKLINPNEALVLLFFGKYYGTISKDGFYWVNPFCTGFNPASSGIRTFGTFGKKISMKAITHNNEKQKINDSEGNPIEIGVVLIWRIINTAKSVFNVENYSQFVSTQADAATRHVTRQFPYDADNDEKSLRGSSLEVSELLKKDLQERVDIAGVEIIEARISHLAYSPEIAAAMLQRQQASAVIAARQKIVDGAVGMVEMALEKLAAKNVVQLDEERKAAMVSNLLVVLCGNKDAQPIVNSGSIY
ncbi:MAG: SPFH domain-containing protein [Firmicutes bacterium]|nr:SPFH domain-containing protein [Bacillota bacterium]